MKVNTAKNEVIWLKQLRACVQREHDSIVDFLTILQQLDAERGWATLGYSSLFVFCCDALGLTPFESASRIRLLNLGKNVPGVLPALRDRSITPTGLRLLAPLVTPNNFSSLLAQVRGKSTREIEAFCRIQTPPKPCLPRDIVRAVTKRGTNPETKADTKTDTKGEMQSEIETSEKHQQLLFTPPSPSSTALSSESTPAPAPAPLEYRLGFSVSQDVYERLQKVRELASHRCNPGSLESVFELLIDDYLKRHDPGREVKNRAKKAEAVKGTEKEPKISTDNKTSRDVVNRLRTIPAAVRREVWKRDGGKCTYCDPTTGRRCESQRYLHIDHIKPFAWGGSSTDPTNLRLLCSVHNDLAARNCFGNQFMNLVKQTERQSAKS